jgi:serine/threonine-protein kinase HipA
MNCLACYTNVPAGYCLSCRKKIFDKAKVPTTLPFDAPTADNIAAFQEHSKRLSISGVQLKYSLRLENGTLGLNEKNAQYILKPIPPSKQLVNLEAVPENEHLTMQIAEQVFKIRTAANALIYFKDGQPNKSYTWRYI